MSFLAPTLTHLPRSLALISHVYRCHATRRMQWSESGAAAQGRPKVPEVVAPIVLYNAVSKDGTVTLNLRASERYTMPRLRVSLSEGKGMEAPFQLDLTSRNAGELMALRNAWQRGGEAARVKVVAGTDVGHFGVKQGSLYLYIENGGAAVAGAEGQPTAPRKSTFFRLSPGDACVFFTVFQHSVPILHDWTVTNQSLRIQRAGRVRW